MSDAQVNEFRSRVDRIESSPRTSKRALPRDRYGVIVLPKEGEKRFKWMSVLRPLLLLYVLFTIFKAVFIYNSSDKDYTQLIVNLEAGDRKSQLVAAIMSPDVFTKPVGVLVAGLADRVKGTQNK
jgi:hypothetical protein